MTGCKDNASTSCEVEMDGPKTIGATFKPICPSGCVSAACGGRTVTFGDEVETTTSHGVVDKADSLEHWLWECHSDNGTVRQCSLPKEDD